MKPKLVTGLFSKNHGNSGNISKKTLLEVEHSLQINQWYREKLLFLAGDSECAQILQKMGIRVHRIFEDAPNHIKEKPAFRMKHWMVYQTVKEFGEVIWIDWDTISLRPVDSKFFRFCIKSYTPKFVYIPGYPAKVNCSVYYVNDKWLSAMEKSFTLKIPSSNDEFMWEAVLPTDVTEKKEFWWGDFVVNIWLKKECSWATSNTYFAHVRSFDYLKPLEHLRVKQSSYGSAL